MTFNVIAGLLALFVLKPMRRRHFAHSRETFPTTEGVVRTRPT
jgi:hypothetical protein